MLEIREINHIGIRISDREASEAFYGDLGFELTEDAGFDDGHPIIMKHPGGVVLNLLGPAKDGVGENILMDVAQKYPGVTHFALTVDSLDNTKALLARLGIEITGSFSFRNMSAVFIRDPDRNVIELDAYTDTDCDDRDGYAHHPD